MQNPKHSSVSLYYGILNLGIILFFSDKVFINRAIIESKMIEFIAQEDFMVGRFNKWRKGALH